ncbi:MAG TPA: 30S ribosomal protein S12 methylthiotransferase RimO [Saprospiraceae bacterium]|nr:30S ribosomal protein S12 methylthiotransferase RimO [Saprospiraceae bacterium]
MKVKSLKKDKVNVITLGCSKNLVDSENIITQLKANAYDVVHEAHDDNANIIVVNTCGFIDLAKQESVDTILHYAKEKTEGRIEKLYVTGCLSQRYKDDLETEIPEVDAFFGTMELPALLGKFNADYKHELIGERITTTPTHFAYLKISEGCNRTCSFCAIPLMRGGHVSRPIEALVKEAQSLARMGVKEIMLIAQELTYYGLDIYKERKLGPLLEALSEVEGIEWIRLHYAYPSKFPREVFDYMAKLPKVCKYLDIPLQHASNTVLARMKRQTTMEEQRELIEYARQIVPNIAIRTTFLVGFPDESVKEFNELCKFVKDMQFERVGVFQYSHEEGTSAYLMKDNVAPKTKKNRAEKLMEIQRDIAMDKNLTKVGMQFKVLIDKKEGGYFVGRTEYDSPEVDNEVLIDASKFFVRIGDFVEVKIVSAEEYDLFAELI